VSAPVERDFALLGGPLHRAGARLGLVRGGTNTFRLGLALGVVPWLIGVLLAAFEGRLAQLFAVDVIAAHVRMLVAIPLLFACEAVFAAQIRGFVGYCSRSGLLVGEASAAFEAQLARTARWMDSRLPDAACLALAVLLAIARPETPWGGVTAEFDERRELSLAGWWHWIVCLTLLRFLLFRWVVRLALWCHVLWRLSRLDLRLMPAHADRSGGLGLLGDVQAHLLPFIVASAAVLSASFAEDIVTGAAPFEAIYLAAVGMLLGTAVLVLGPLTVFTPRLWACKQQGLRDYHELAARYAASFDRKWLNREPAAGEPLLGSADIQSLADLSGGVDIVRGMRLIPMAPRPLMYVAAATLLPLLPLLTLRYPVSEMINQLVERLIGL
jgi:hypothetical protein